MVICIVALVILAVMGIFSAKYRKWAREAFQCVARRVTLRPCTTGFNEKVKAVITGSLMKRSTRLARFTHRHFEAISWVFTIAFFISLAYTAYGMYNLATLGTCDPTNPSGCIFNPGGDPNRVICPYENLEPNNSVPTIGNFRNIESAVVQGRPMVYFFGTTWCPHCAWERPIITEVAGKFSGYIDFKSIEIDVEQPAADMPVFNHYSPSGSIPLVILGGKYFRVGSGETLGEQGEKQALTAILCKITSSPTNVTECAEPDIKALIDQI